jgi:hypothetical protein
MYVCMYVCMYGWMDGWMDGLDGSMLASTVRKPGLLDL